MEGNEQKLAEASLLLTVIGHSKKTNKQTYTHDLDTPFSKFPSSLVLRIFFLHFEVDQTSCSGAVTCRGIL